jgi:hypothetical protein
MLRTSEEIQLLSTALEPGIRNPSRSEHGPAEILRDFFTEVDFTGQRVLELGPGHYEFCEAVRRQGAAAEAVELDPPVIELGRRRGFKVWPGNLTQLPALAITPGFDGLFCKGSNNPFWVYGDEAALRAYIQSMVGLVKPGGWLWIVSCPYSKPALPAAEFNRWLDLEARIYRELGFSEWLLPHKAVASYYGISFEHPRLAVFTKGLPAHRWSAPTAVLLPWFCAKVLGRRLLRKLGR